MALQKVGFLALLLLGILLPLLSKVESQEFPEVLGVEANKACPRNCNPQISYGRCPQLGNKKFKVGCTNCCAGSVGCNYFSANGAFICEGETEAEKQPKICPRNCDGRVAYMTCPHLGLAQITQVCVNCCSAGKGCKLYGRDGSLLCTGELQSF